MIEPGCKFSDDTFGPDGRGQYRYTLVRKFSDTHFTGGIDPRERLVMFVGLNPSTADGATDDPTVARCSRRAITMGFRYMAMMNIFAYRSTDPKPMLKMPSAAIIGCQNNEWLIHMANQSEMIIAAWGTNGKKGGRGREVWEMLKNIREIHCLRRTKSGYPEHPLYLPYDLRPKLYVP